MTFYKLELFLALAFIVLLSSCQTLEGIQNNFAYKRGTNVTSDQMATFIINESTKAEIINRLGEPQVKSKDASLNVLEYHYSQINHLSRGVEKAWGQMNLKCEAIAKRKNALIIFDEIS